MKDFIVAVLLIAMAMILIPFSFFMVGAMARLTLFFFSLGWKKMDSDLK